MARQPEKPRDVYTTACTEIGKRFAPDGFRYLKSMQSIVRDVGPMRQEITCWSSHHNEPGEYVELTARFETLHKGLAKWSKSVPVGGSGHLAGGAPGTLTPDKKWMEWDLADPTARTDALDDIEGVLRRLVLPHFELLVDTPRLMREVSEHEVLAIWEPRIVRYALFLGDGESARNTARRLLAADPELDERTRALVRDQATPETLRGEHTAGILATLPLFHSLSLD